MTAMEITLLCILMVISTASAAIIWRLHLEFKSYKQAAEIMVTQLARQLHYHQMSTRSYLPEQCSGSPSIH